MPRIPARARTLGLAALALVVTASVATVAGVSTAEDRPTRLSTATTAAADNSNNTAVLPLSRRNGFTDIVYVGSEGRIKFATRFPNSDDWFTGFLNGGVVAPDTRVTGVARGTGRLDIFAVGTDRNVYTAYLDEAIDGEGSLTWHGWFKLPALTVDVGSSVHVVAPSRDQMDLFTIQHNRDSPKGGRPWTLRWRAESDWGTWQRLENSDESFTAGFGAEVTAVTVGRDIHVFAGRAIFGRFQPTERVYTKRYVDGVWTRWEEMNPNVDIAYMSEVVAVRRRVSSAVEAYVVTRGDEFRGIPQTLVTATWNGSSWSNFTTLFDEAPQWMTAIGGVSRGRTNQDIFMVAGDGSVRTAAFTAADGWHGWWPLGGVVGEASSVSALSDGIGDIQIFVHGQDMNDVFPVWTRRWSSATGWGEWENVTP